MHRQVQAGGAGVALALHRRMALEKPNRQSTGQRSSVRPAAGTRHPARASLFTVVLASASACMPEPTRHRLRPQVALEQRGRISARIVEVQYSPGTDSNTIVVAVANHSGTAVRLDPTKIRGLRPAAADSSNVGSPMRGAISGARVGGSLSGSLGSSGSGGSGGSGSGAGSLAGAGVGMAVGMVVVLPFAVVKMVGDAWVRRERVIRPGDEVWVQVQNLKAIDDGGAHFLDLSAAFDRPVDLNRVPLVALERRDGGYRLDGEVGKYFSFRLGGGPLHRPGADDLPMGGIAILGGGMRAGRASLGGYLSILPFPELAAGLELGVNWDLSKTIRLMTAVDYSAHYLIVGKTFAHGPSLRAELLFPAEYERFFDIDVASMRIGPYAATGPVFMPGDPGWGWQWQVGLAIR